MKNQAYIAQLRALLDNVHGARRRRSSTKLKFQPLNAVSWEAQRPGVDHIKKISEIGSRISSEGISLHAAARSVIRNQDDAAVLNAAWDAIAGWRS